MVGIPEHAADVRPLSKVGQALLADVLRQREGGGRGRRCSGGWSLQEMATARQQRANTTEDGAKDGLDSLRRIVVDLNRVDDFLEGVNNISDYFLLWLQDDPALLLAPLCPPQFSPDQELVQKPGCSPLQQPGQLRHHRQVGTRGLQEVGEITGSGGDNRLCQYGKQ